MDRDSSDGNILALFFGIAAEGQARRIMGHIEARALDRQTPLRTCDPVYPVAQVFPFYVVAGLADYHRTLIWPWLGTVHAINKTRLTRREAGIADLARIAAWYVERNAVAEVYTSEGRPVSRRFYQAEVPFAWNAGLYVYAVHALGLAGQAG